LKRYASAEFDDLRQIVVHQLASKIAYTSSGRCGVDRLAVGRTIGPDLQSTFGTEIGQPVFLGSIRDRVVDEN